MTTRALHVALHAPSADASTSTILPSPLPPRSFLERYARSRNPAASAPEETGTWSVSYLKKRLLKEMETQGQVVKLTRGKWDKLLADASSTPATKSAAVDEKTKGSKKEEEEHVWMHGGVYKNTLKQAAGAREARAAARALLAEENGEQSIRAEYGLRSRKY
jgi:hypothetical protein